MSSNYVRTYNQIKKLIELWDSNNDNQDEWNEEKQLNLC